MSKLTKFEALQLAALLATRREWQVNAEHDVKELFDLAAIILKEDENSEPKSKGEVHFI